MAFSQAQAMQRGVAALTAGRRPPPHRPFVNHTEYLHIRLGDVETGIYVNGLGGYLHRANAPAVNLLRAGVSYSF